MIQTSENKVLLIAGKAFEKKFNTVYFQMSGDRFPNSTGNGNEEFTIGSYDQSLEINYGDGVVETFQFVNNAISFTKDGTTNGRVSNPSVIKPNHYYTDGKTSNRTVTFKFQNINNLNVLRVFDFVLSGAFPNGLLYAKNISSIILSNVLNLTSFPNDLSTLTNLRQLDLSKSSLIVANKIPDVLFSLDLTSFGGDNMYDLSNPIGSNIFKLNIWKNMLYLRLNSCNITSFDETFKELINIKSLIINNQLNEFPTQIEYFTKLLVIQIGVSGTNRSFINFKNLNLLESVLFNGNFNLSEIPTKWVGLVSLKGISTFAALVSSNSRFNEFIDEFYTLCSTNGSIVNNGAAAPYQNRFRNIAWGHNSLAFTGAKTAPSGYTQGGSNGTPANQGQKAYVLQNQYNHTITHF
jgi:hypothetical protein